MQKTSTDCSRLTRPHPPENSNPPYTTQCQAEPCGGHKTYKFLSLMLFGFFLTVFWLLKELNFLRFYFIVLKVSTIFYGLKEKYIHFACYLQCTPKL